MISALQDTASIKERVLKPNNRYYSGAAIKKLFVSTNAPLLSSQCCRVKMPRGFKGNELKNYNFLSGALYPSLSCALSLTLHIPLSLLCSLYLSISLSLLCSLSCALSLYIFISLLCSLSLLPFQSISLSLSLPPSLLPYLLRRSLY